MKPEVRRALAKEWLILMAIVIAVTLGRAGWLYSVNVQLDHAGEALWRKYAEWGSYEKEVRQFFKESYSKWQDPKNRIGDLPKENEDPNVIFAREQKDNCMGEIKILQQNLSSHPDPRTTQGWIASATWAVEWSWLVYLALWVPRLTVGSIRLLRNSANKTAHP